MKSARLFITVKKCLLTDIAAVNYGSYFRQICQNANFYIIMLKFKLMCSCQSLRRVRQSDIWA